MKIRNGFVSNSSSASFYPLCFRNRTLKEESPLDPWVYVADKEYPNCGRYIKQSKLDKRNLT